MPRNGALLFCVKISDSAVTAVDNEEGNLFTLNKKGEILAQTGVEDKEPLRIIGCFVPEVENSYFSNKNYPRKHSWKSHGEKPVYF